MRDFSFWEEYEGTSEGSGRSEKIWLQNPDTDRTTKDYLYLIWKCSTTRRQYIIGQLTRNGEYEFQYCGEIEAAMDAGFKPLVAFENLDVVYRCKELFPVFSSRLPDRKRKDIGKILEKYGLKEYDAYELLKKSGTRLPIDNLQFADPLKKEFQDAGTKL